MLEVVIFVGLQGSGKTTYYRGSFESTHVLVSQDRSRNNRRPARRQEQGFNPKLGLPVTAVRRRVKVDRDLPLGEEYQALLRRLLGS